MWKLEPGRRGRGRWLTLGQAAESIGVDPATLRGWADAGKVRVFRTPGGHRRFDAADLNALLQASAPPRASVQPIPGLPEARTIGPLQWLAARPWYAGTSEPSRARVRSHCAELMQVVATYLAGRPARARHLAAARRIGAALGREVAEWGITPAQSTEVFLRFKMHVTEALADSRGHGREGERVRSMRDADAFLAATLQAMMETYETGLAHGGRG